MWSDVKSQRHLHVPTQCVTRDTTAQRFLFFFLVQHRNVLFSDGNNHWRHLISDQVRTVSGARFTREKKNLVENKIKRNNVLHQLLAGHVFSFPAAARSRKPPVPRVANKSQPTHRTFSFTLTGNCWFHFEPISSINMPFDSSFKALFRCFWT